MKAAQGRDTARVQRIVNQHGFQLEKTGSRAITQPEFVGLKKTLQRKGLRVNTCDSNGNVIEMKGESGGIDLAPSNANFVTPDFCGGRPKNTVGQNNVKAQGAIRLLKHDNRDPAIKGIHVERRVLEEQRANAGLSMQTLYERVRSNF